MKFLSNKLYFLFFFAFVFTCGTLLSQNIRTISIDSKGASKVFKNRAMVYDSNGMLWYANPQGIVKETGTTNFFFPFEKLNNRGIKIGRVTNLILVNNNELWLLSNSSHIYRFNIDTQKGKWLSLDSIYPTKILGDHDGNVWMNSNSNSVIKFNTNYTSFKNITLPDKISSRNEEYIPFIFMVNGKIIIRGAHHFFYMVNGTAYKLEDLPFISGNKIIQLRPFEVGYLRNSKSSGFYKYNNIMYTITYSKTLDCHFAELPKVLSRDSSNIADLNKVSFTKLIPKDHSIRKNSSLDLLSIKGNILNCFSLQTNTKIPELILEKSIKLSGIGSAIALGADEIAVLSGNAIDVIQLTNDKLFDGFLNKNLNTIVRPLTESIDGTLYVQSRQGLYKKKNNQFYKISDSLNLNTQAYNAHIKTYDMEIDSHSNLWMFGWDQLLKINLKNYSHKYYHFNKLYSQNHFLLFKDADAFKLIIPSEKGLYEFSANTEKLTSKSKINNNIKLTHVDFILKDDAQNFWLSGSHGILKLNTNYEVVQKLVFSALTKKLKNQKVKRLFLTDTKHELWILLDSNDILKVNLLTETVISDEFFKTNYLKIANILQDADDIWVATFNGLYHFNIASPQEKQRYSTLDGLPDNEFNTNSFLKLKNGTLLFGGMNGFIQFKSKDILKGKTFSKLMLVNNCTDQDTIDLITVNEFKLPYKAANICLQFATNLGLFKADKINYYYRILDRTNHWTAFNNNGLLELQALREGKHILEVKASYRGNDSNILSYEIFVNKIFYKQSWFIFLIVGSVLVLLYAFMRHKEFLRLLKYNNQKNIDQLKLKVIQAQMNPHFLYNTINNLQNILIHKKREEIDLYFKEFTNLIRKTLDLSRLKKVSLEKEIAYLNSYLILNQMRLNDELSFTIKVNPNIDPKNMYIPTLLIQPHIENAIIHGLKPKKGLKKLEISFQLTNNKLEIIVFDNGIGRKASLAIQRNSILKTSSLSSNIFKNYLHMNNTINKDSIQIKIIDLTPETHNNFGTKVIISTKFFSSMNIK
ncbi:histidine kinase [uncultured Polaribacter sp.]|uniref:histidine kinase n=1 Tax=uncultured Polaribacter sp. TaxID=174711 RepID=UPI002634C8ED|nr:histidine kinase [uncultured Polaribacter sp.]